MTPALLMTPSTAPNRAMTVPEEPGLVAVCSLTKFSTQLASQKTGYVSNTDWETVP